MDWIPTIYSWKQDLYFWSYSTERLENVSSSQETLALSLGMDMGLLNVTDVYCSAVAYA